MGNQKEFVEKRKDVRLAVGIPIKYRIYTENDKKPLTEWMQGTTENVSIDGVRFKTLCNDKQIEILTNECIVLTADFQLPETKHSLKCETKLIYFSKSTDTKDKEKETVFLGLSFMNIDEKGKNVISEFIRKKR